MIDISIQLSDEIEARLSQLEKRTGQSKSFYIPEAVIQHLDDLEGVFLAEQRLKDIRAGVTKTIPIEEVMKRYDLED